MCGITGIYTPDEAARQPDFAHAVQAMTGLLIQRGPDHEGYWADPAGRVQLGFRRLAVIDLSEAASQPMVSGDERSVIVFNGEMYNFRDLRRALEKEGVVFRSRSDTEVVLEALNRWGTEALDRFNGMFALAWYDRPRHTLLLARDHAGIKPLYYYLHPQGRGLAFGSQYDTLLNTPWGQPGDVQPDVLRLYFKLHHLPPPFALLENTYQLEPGQYQLYGPAGLIEHKSWWRLPRDPEPTLKPGEHADALQAALAAAVRRQRIADVPLGVFLSGGVDSPLVTAVARQQTDSSLKGFTIGNPDWRQDESEDAVRYAELLDVDLQLHNISGLKARQLLEEVIAASHEPFGDYSIIPTLLVSRAARADLTVALSGDGGDELFWGYVRPFSLMRDGHLFKYPWMVRAGLYGLSKYGSLPKRSSAIVFRTPGDYYFEVNSRMPDAVLARIAPGLPDLPASFHLYHMDGYHGERNLANYSRYVEFYGQLQRGLKKVDMASMHESLEVRVPLLDRQVIDVSLGMNPLDAMRSGERKQVLRDVLSRYVPASVIPAEKRGFAVPLGQWLRDDLRDLVEDTLFGGQLYPVGLFDPAELRRWWAEHQSGQADHKWALYTLLSLQWWAQRNVQAVPGAERRPNGN